LSDEKEFLSSYRMEDYPRPSVTADIVAFMIRAEDSGNYRRNSRQKLTVLLIRRGGHPYKGCWALPGGFLNPGETIEQCALREVEEETAVKPVSLMSVGLFSEPDRDPRGWIISNAFVSIISDEKVRWQAGDDAADARWFDVGFDRIDGGGYLLTLSCGEISLQAVLTEKSTGFGTTRFSVVDSGGLAFDHASIIATALTALRSGAKEFEYIFDFLPEAFTLTQLQNVQETIMNISVLPANFRRKIASFVEETDEYTQGAGHRPAKLYRRKPTKG
jgi:ADP-ribose pyrophosphatase YjhB (NUDIX family)